MSGDTLLVVGNDRISGAALEQIGKVRGVVVVIDDSTNLSRVFRLIRRGKLSPLLLARMVLCERRRSAVLTQTYPRISGNTELAQLIQTCAPQRVILFRAGLIINNAVLSAGVPVMNIHCARVPQYGGIGSIHRALRDRAFDQCATLHQVTASIDDGVVHDTEPYELNPTDGYCRNEDRAYEAGVRLLKRVLV